MPDVMEETCEPPDWLDELAQKEWRRVAPMLVRNGLLTEMDLDALTAYCQAWVTWKTASEQIKKFGMVIKAANGFPMTSPYLPIANKALMQIKAFLTEFGMTPSSRTKVQRSAPVRKALTPLEQLQQQAKQMKHG
jgi:P27 family predicted phage terminase small subunit